MESRHVDISPMSYAPGSQGVKAPPSTACGDRRFESSPGAYVGVAPDPLRPSAASREFQFTYRFGDCEWGVTIFANDPAEAREKIKAVALARYDGEVAMKIPVPMGGFIRRAWRALIGHH